MPDLFGNPCRLTRRALVKVFGAAAVTALAIPSGVRAAVGTPRYETDPFSLGVASGDPLPDGFVLWTRLAPRPLEPGYGMAKEVVEVLWELAADDRFRQPVLSGAALARPELGHSVHVELEGLAPSHDYFYRFRVGDHVSRTGRARTAPVPGAKLKRFHLGVVGCQEYEQGFYTAHCYLAHEAPDAIFCYGDYIYEGDSREKGYSRFTETAVPNPRRHHLRECYALDEYRQRYAVYKLDQDLQASHAAAPWIAVWDDHEVANNWVSDHDGDIPPELFRLRRVAAAQAYYENMPLRRQALPLGPDYRLFRRLAFGDLLDMHVLDTRSYRSDQPCATDFGPTCDDRNRPGSMVLGAAQEAWLSAGLVSSGARWQALAQQIMVMPCVRERDPQEVRNQDSWDGYTASRQRLLDMLHQQRIGNVVVLTGDEHQNYAGDLRLNAEDPGSPIVATEFVGTSISSGGDGGDARRQTPQVLRDNPHIRLINDQRGYLLCEVTLDQWTTRLKVLDQVSRPGGTLIERACFAVERGRPGTLSL